jgi:ClpP class serine protease
MQFDPFTLIFLFFFLSSFTPLLQRRLIEAQRDRLLQEFERKRKSRVIAMIHRQEQMAFLGIPIARYIDIEDSEQVLRAIHLTPPEVPIDLILHTPGGLVLAAEQIANALCRHPGKVTVFVPHYAMSGGTLIALAADEIVMDPNAVLGPVDPQVGQFPAASILSVLEAKPIAEIDDQTLILADISRKALRQVTATVQEILVANGMAAERAAAIAQQLATGQWTHDYPISVREAQALGLPVSEGLPQEIYTLMSYYREPTQRRPSVTYIPLPQPYRREEEPRKTGR